MTVTKPDLLGGSRGTLAAHVRKPPASLGLTVIIVPPSSRSADHPVLRPLLPENSARRIRVDRLAT